MYKNKQTLIPSEIREKFDVDENTIIEWGVDEHGKPQINFRKKITLKDDNVFEIFKKYNSDSFKVSFIDCSIVLLSKYFNLDYIVTYDKNFKLFEEINLLELTNNIFKF